MSARFRFNGRIFRESPLACYLVLACTFTWSLLPLASNSVVIGLVALFGPALSAAAVSRFHQSDRKQLLLDRRAVGVAQCDGHYSRCCYRFPLRHSEVQSSMLLGHGGIGCYNLSRFWVDSIFLSRRRGVRLERIRPATIASQIWTGDCQRDCRRNVGVVASTIVLDAFDAPIQYPLFCLCDLHRRLIGHPDYSLRKDTR